MGFLGMVVFYDGLLWLTTKDALHPVYFFAQKWYFLAPIFLGFGYQLFLFQRLRFLVHEHRMRMAGASAGTSAFAMAACCVHHAADVLPFVGLTVVAGGISQFQDVFLGLGVAINAVGVWYMWTQIQKYQHMSCEDTVST